VKRTIYLAALLVVGAVCQRASAQAPAWTAPIKNYQMGGSYVNLQNVDCGWVPVYPGTVTIVGTLAAGVTVNVYGQIDSYGTWTAPDGQVCPNNDIINATEIQVVQTGPSGSNYSQIVNGQPWPLDFRPYCYNSTANPNAPCPFNDKLPDSPQKLLNLTMYDPTTGTNIPLTSAGVIGAMNAAGDLNFTFTTSNAIPEYLASSSDPVVTVTCNDWCQNGIGSKNAVKINIPKKARGGLCPPSDCLMAIIEPNGVEYSIYGMSAQYSGGSTISAAGLAWASIVTSNGVDPNGAFTSPYPGAGGGDVGNGTLYAVEDNSIRINEISNGVIPHALHTNLVCATGEVYPGNYAADCSGFGYNGPPAGARFQLILNDAQINGTQSNSIGYTASKAAAWEKVILHAMHDYGVIGDITCGSDCGGAIYLYTEAPEQYTAYGTAWPGTNFNWTSPGSPGGGGVGSLPNPWTPGGLNWAKALRIVDPCYSLETCTQ
jgi:hypothetical protein